MDPCLSGGHPPKLGIRHDSDVALATCQDNHLNDRTIAALRDQGCDTMENLRYLRPEDLPTLGLPIGQQRRLEEALLMIYTQRNGNPIQPPTQPQHADHTQGVGGILSRCIAHEAEGLLSSGWARGHFLRICCWGIGYPTIFKLDLTLLGISS